MFSRLAGRRLLRDTRVLGTVATVLLWLIQLVFLGGLLLSLRSALQQSIVDDLELAVQSFMERNRLLFFGPDVFSSSFDERSLEGLAFVRIIRGQQHLLFSSDRKSVV